MGDWRLTAAVVVVVVVVVVVIFLRVCEGEKGDFVTLNTILE